MEKLKKMMERQEKASVRNAPLELIAKRPSPPTSPNFNILEKVRESLFKDLDVPSEKINLKKEKSEQKQAQNITSEEIDKWKEHRKIFTDEFSSLKEYKRKYPFCKELTFKEKCDDLRVFILKKLTLVEDQSLAVLNYGTSNEKSSDSRHELNRSIVHDLKPLITLLEAYNIDKEILECFFQASHFALLGKFNLAEDKYLEIAIGCKGWPIGIPVLGVHERTGTSRIFSSYILRLLSRPHE